MNPNDQTYRTYSEGQLSHALYPPPTTTSASGLPLYPQPVHPQEQAYYPSPYPPSQPFPDNSMAPYQPELGHGPPLQPHSEVPYDITPDWLPESEKERQKNKRKEQNRVAQREFRQRNKYKIKELQEKLESLSNEVRSLRDDKSGLLTERGDLEKKIVDLTKENEELKSSVGSSPASTAESPWWQPASTFDTYPSTSRASLEPPHRGY